VSDNSENYDKAERWRRGWEAGAAFLQTSAEQWEDTVYVAGWKEGRAERLAALKRCEDAFGIEFRTVQLAVKR
jgi:hypothetical protein